MLTRTLASNEIDQHIRSLKAYGYTRVEQLLSQDTLETVRAIIRHHSQKASGPSGAFKTADSKAQGILFNIQNLDKTFVDLIAEPAVTTLCMPFLNDPYYGSTLPSDVPNYILGYYTARSSPMNTPLPLHIDSIIPAPGPRTWAMQVIFMMDDQTIANGCSIVVPGSHHSGEYTDRELKNTLPVESKAGDAVIWDSRLWHGALPNRTGAERWAVIATFHMWWLKQKMDIPRILPEAVYSQLSDMQKQLLGFCTIPPRDSTVEINTKRGYESLLPRVVDYYA